MSDEKCVIIANPHGKAWDYAKEIFKYVKQREQEELQLQPNHHDCSIYRYLQERTQRFELNSLNIDKFPDSEYRVRIGKNLRGRICFLVHDSNLKFSDWTSQLLLSLNAIRNSSPERIIVVAPYLRGSRQERKDVSRTSINVQAIASICAYHNAGMVTLDIHSKATQGMFHGPGYTESLMDLDTFPHLIEDIKKNNQWMLENITVLFPDEGSMKRHGDYMEALKFEIAIADKYRDKKTGKVKVRAILGDISGRNVLEPDDIISTGGTQIEVANFARGLKNPPASINGYGTFAFCTRGIHYVSKHLDNLLISDVIKPKIERERRNRLPKNTRVVSTISLLGEGIYRISRNESLSELLTLDSKEFNH